MTTLPSLIKRLEESEGPSRELDVDIMNEVAPFPTTGRRLFVWARTGGLVRDGVYTDDAPELTGSVDAAIALAERVLPGWGWDVASNTPHIKACLDPDLGAPCAKYPHWAAVSNVSSHNFHDAATPAMALCVAILKALQSKGEQP